MFNVIVLKQDMFMFNSLGVEKEEKNMNLLIKFYESKTLLRFLR